MFAFEHTSLENFQGSFGEIKRFLQEKGYDEGGNWEYDHGYFDKKIADSPGYLFIRIPIIVQEGTFGEDEARVKIGTPFLLRHKYQIGNDDHVHVTLANASLNQFAEPQDPDASLEQDEIDSTWEIIRRLEEDFQASFKR
ncbi:YugN family protein [Bacillus horti]|uniref:YugN-like family protein n=1 Tax=Caldalkalibacillus horti TaxID=77523 RepID=A0ABT9VTS4_9BACI|nr:YugN family protein [Bacillus horti]MDQ0164383.1 hypothetical protein [Bacillus horti]